MNEKYFKKVSCPLCKSKGYEKLFSKTDHHEYLYKKNEKPLIFTVVKCKKCDLTYMNPTLTDEGLKKIYIKEYIDYTNFNNLKKSQQNALIKGFQKKMSHIIKKTGLKNGALLDFGCGYGNFIKYNKKTNHEWEFYGYDFNNEIKTNKKLNLFFAKDIENTNIPKKYFDVIIMIETLEHFTELDKIFEKLSKYLKDDGFLYIETGNIDNLFTKIKKQNHVYYVIYHTIYFSRKTIKILLERKKYSIIDISDYVVNEDLFYCKQKFNIKQLIRGSTYEILKNIKIKNFSVTGGMSIIAQKKRSKKCIK